MTRPNRILKVHSPEDAAMFAISIIEGISLQKEQITIGVPGGRSIQSIITGITKKPKLMQKATFVLVDERRTGTKNADTVSSLGNKLIAPEITDSVEKDLQAYKSLLKPFDCVIFGVGEDGHIASLFPGNEALNSSDLVAHVTDSPKEPKERMTITYNAIQKDATIILLFLGKTKKNALRFFLEEDDYFICPSSYFKTFENLYVITDQNVN